MKKKLLLRGFALVVFVLGATVVPVGSGYAQGGSRTFPETGKTVKGRFLEYWNANGGLAQQGFPISDEFQERSDTNGKTYTVQYFERAAFEAHPENKAPFDVLLSLLGNFLYKQKYPNGAPNQQASTTNPRKFSETGKTLGGKFRSYWEANGGLAQQGFPISDEFQERSDLDGKTYLVQYFERAVFELHPENAGTRFEVLLSQLGTFRYRQKYGQVTIPTATRPAATPTRPRPTSTPIPPVETIEPVESPTSLVTGTIMRGSFDRQPNGDSASGSATLTRQGDGSVVLTLQLERVSSAPALVVWITETANPTNSAQMMSGGHLLGALKSTTGASTYSLSSSINASKVRTVVIFCKDYNVIISNAAMQTP